MSQQESSDSLKALSTFFGIVAAITGVLAAFLHPAFGVSDLDVGSLAAGLACAVAASFWVWLRSAMRWPVKAAMTILFLGFGAIWGFLLLPRWSRPQFDITALHTLEGDKNAYELTDFLIWNADEAAIEHRLPITFTFEITPRYSGKQRYGRILAIISGEEGTQPLEKPLDDWDTFSSDSKPVRLNLTLPELVKTSGIGVNYDLPGGRFGSEDPPFEQAKLLIKIAEEADKTHPLDEEAITIRNSPWDFRSYLVSRENGRQVDVWIKNLGGPGDYTVAYELMRQDRLIDSSTHPLWNGATRINYWNEPTRLFHLERGGFITDTVSLPGDLSPGRYILAAWPIKRMPYISFSDPQAKWEDVRSLPMSWWYSDPIKVDRDVFVVDISVEDPAIEAERQRVLNQEGVDVLGLALEPAEEITSAAGIKGLHQVFQGGEIFVHGGKAYALYGPILTHYRELHSGPLKDAAGRALGFPISSVQTVTSTNGTVGTLVEFESNSPELPPSAIYASSKGVAAVWGAIRQLYLARSGHTGWLGFPLSDEQYFADSTIQMFESGYAVYYYPKVSDDERDRGRPVIAYPYPASRGNLFDVDASQGWQDTGIQLQPGDRVSIVQVGGAWSALPDGKLLDAGESYFGNQSQQSVWPPAPVGSLIGRIGETSDSIFAVGGWSTIQSPSTGTLYLAMNDGNYSDNRGLVTVQIMVNPPE